MMLARPTVDIGFFQNTIAAGDAAIAALKSARNPVHPDPAEKVAREQLELARTFLNSLAGLQVGTDSRANAVQVFMTRNSFEQGDM